MWQIDRMRMGTVTGWIAAGSSSAIAGFWAYWGGIETFHEGWYYHSFWKNVGLTFGQYLSPMMLFMLLALAALRWPRIGALLHLALGILIPLMYVRTPAALLFIAGPMIVIGLLYWFSRPGMFRRALFVTGIPLLMAVAWGAGPAIRVAGRIDDGVRDARLVEGNGVSLVWAPRGPGWPDDNRGYTWEEADSICASLTEDGTAVGATRQDFWRLPSVDEAVRSMVRHGTNAGGSWDPEALHAAYAVQPDKESPLWDRYSPVIYWWTSTVAGEGKAYRIAYNGQAFLLPRRSKYVSLAFRAVREQIPPEPGRTQ